MFIKALVRKLHLKVFSPGDFAMEEGESGEEVRGVACHGGRARAASSAYRAISPHHTVPLYPIYN